MIKKVHDRAFKELSASREASSDGAVEMFFGKTAEDEARLVAGRIAQLIGDGHSPGDIAVLCRSVRTSAAPLVIALRERDIPVSVLGKTSLMVQPEMALIARIFVYWGGDLVSSR